MLYVVILAGCASAPVRGDPHVEFYNVQDIVVCDKGSDFALHCKIPDDPSGCNQLVNRARQAIPAPWDGETGWSLVYQDGLLIVRADAEAQRSVRSFLASERSRIEEK